MLRLLAQRVDDRARPLYRAYADDAGFDLSVIGHHALRPGQVADLPTGWRIGLPDGYYARITGRSSALRKRGLFVNEGIIDTGYRGDLFVLVRNDSGKPAIIPDGDRLAELILAPVVAPGLEVVDSLPLSERGAQGFGSSGGHTPPSVYLGLPIDRADDPDWPHRAWDDAGGPTAYCPYCVQRQSPLPAEAAMARNMAALEVSDRAVFFFDQDSRSFGVPVEMWRATEDPTTQVYVVGELAPGLFTSAMRGRGVAEFPTVLSLLLEWTQADA